MPSLRRLVSTLLASVLATVSAAGALELPSQNSKGEIASPNATRNVIHADVQSAMSRGVAWRAFQQRNGSWRALWNESTKTPHRALGTPIALPSFRGDAASADQATREFIDGHADVFGDPGTLELAAAVKAGAVWYVGYRQMVGGIPVRDADWEFRIGEQGLLGFGADRYQVPGQVVTAPRIAEAVAREASKSGIAFDPATDRAETRGLSILPIARDGGVDYRLVYEAYVVTHHPRQTWRVLVDATNGDIVERSSMLRHAITGSVTGTVHPLLPSDPLSALPMRNIYVTGGTTTGFTDASGNYSINPAGTVTLTSAMRGRYCNVDRCVNEVCPTSDAAFSRPNTTNPSTVNIAWGSSNSQTAERDAYYHMNLAHDWVKAIEPSYTGNDYELVTYVEHTDSDCDAWWDFFTNTMNFMAAGSGCPSTATIPDIIYHEYGHAVNDNLFVQQGRPGGMSNYPLQEALADVYAAFMTDDPVIGQGFFGTGTTLRDITTFRHWPEDANTVRAHETGLILSGAMWNLRQSVGLTTAKTIFHMAKHGLPDDSNDGIAFNEYFYDLLVADDNNGNPSDGTPHYTQIANAFNAHGIGTNFYINIAVTADDQPSVGPFPVTATITYSGLVGGFDPTSTRLYYSINNAAFTSTPMFPTGNPDEYGANVPANVSAVVRYYVLTSTTDGGLKTAPAGAPGRYYSFLGGPFAVMLENDFDNDLGWTVGASGDAATYGIWVRADPVGTAIQPENDHSAAGTLCYVTGNTLPYPDNGVGLEDVDGGKTTVTSSTFDATAGGLIRPVISYWRWYSNNGGDNPSQDAWKVEISNNGGSSWTTVENTLETDQSWRRVLFFISTYVTPTSNMKIRFVANDDTALPSLVEAAVDDFGLYGFPTIVGVEDATPHATLELARPRPNPSRGTTQLSYTLAERGRVGLGVFDIQGREIRSIVAADQEPGPHTFAWDGRDDAGHAVPNGPYFVILTQHGLKRTAGVVVLK